MVSGKEGMSSACSEFIQNAWRKELCANCQRSRGEHTGGKDNENFHKNAKNLDTWNGPRQANLVLIAYASSEGSGEPVHPRSLARTFAARSYKQWIKRNLQTQNQIPSPSDCLGMRSWNLSWRNARRHKFAWRGSNIVVIVKKKQKILQYS